RRQVAAGLADHQDQFRFVIDLLANGRQHNGLIGTNQGGRILAEQDGFFRNGRAAFGGVVAVVEADADDLLRVGHRRQQLGVGGGDANGGGSGGRLFRGLQRGGTGFEQGADAGGQGGVGRVQIDVVKAVKDSGTRAGGSLNGSESHGY